MALGLTLVYGILHVPNFAHGAFGMAGVFLADQVRAGKFDGVTGVCRCAADGAPSDRQRFVS